MLIIRRRRPNGRHTSTAQHSTGRSLTHAGRMGSDSQCFLLIKTVDRACFIQIKHLVVHAKMPPNLHLRINGQLPHTTPCELHTAADRHSSAIYARAFLPITMFLTVQPPDSKCEEKMIQKSGQTSALTTETASDLNPHATFLATLS